MDAQQEAALPAELLPEQVRRMVALLREASQHPQHPHLQERAVDRTAAAHSLQAERSQHREAGDSLDKAAGHKRQGEELRQAEVEGTATGVQQEAVPLAVRLLVARDYLEVLRLEERHELREGQLSRR